LKDGRGALANGRIDPIKNVTSIPDGRIENRAGHPEKSIDPPEIKVVHVGWLSHNCGIRRAT
jgi:hypothetical protein